MTFEQASSWCFLLCVGVYVPWVTVRRALRPPSTDTPALSGIAVRRAVTQTAMFGVMAVVVARVADIDLFSAGTLDWRAIVLAIGVMALAGATIPLRVRWMPPARRARVLRARPQRPADLRGWFVLSLSAGVFEEIMFRGVMFVLLQRLTGDWLSAALLCVVSFTLGHAFQGLAGMSAVAVLAFALQVIVRLTGSLYLAMVVHFVYDCMAGVIYLRLNRPAATGAGEVTQGTAGELWEGIGRG